MMTPLIFNSEDIFQEIPGDPDNVMLTFPPEVLEQTGWQAGDTLTISVVNGAISIIKNG
jgi:hypothetical protein